LFLFLLAFGTLRAQAQQPSPADGFLARSYHSPGGETMQYRLFVPPGYDAAKKYPIVLWLHGANGRGSDNLLQISGGNYLGTHVWTSPEIQAKDPVFVLAPQVENTKNLVAPAREYGGTGFVASGARNCRCSREGIFDRS
jgi:predicted peptidase